MANSATVGLLRILLSADTAQFEAGMKGAGGAAAKLGKEFETLAGHQKRLSGLFDSFSGDTAIRTANELATAVAKVGGASKLTAGEQANVNRVVTEAIAKYQALGQVAPKALLDLAAATKQIKPPALPVDTFGVLAKNLTSIGQQAQNVGMALTKAFTLPLVGIGAAAFKASTDFETAFSGVRKTVAGTPEELAKINAEFREMAKTTPKSAVELAHIGEMAGQLGVQKDKISAFTKTIADISVATNLTADEAGSSFARLANVLKIPQDQFSNLGSAVVALGNFGASTEQEMLDMAQRISAAGATAGMTAPQVLGIANALSSVGINAEAGGTAVSRVINKIATDVASGKGHLETFAKVAEMSAKDFQKAWHDDAGLAFSQFMQGLANARARGGDELLGLMDELGFKEVRLRNAFMAAANAGDLMTTSIKLGTKSYKENTELARAAEERYKTVTNQLKLLWGRLNDVAITIGDALRPAIDLLIEGAGALIPIIDALGHGFAAMPDSMKLTAVGLLGVLAAAGPVLYIFGQLATSAAAVATAFAEKGIATKLLATAFGTVAPAATTAAAGIGEVGVAAAEAEVAATSAAGVFSGAMTAAFGALLSPIGLTITALGLLAAGIYVVMTSKSDLQKSVDANAIAFNKETDALNVLYDRYVTLSATQNRTAEETAELDKVTRALADASGLSVDAFKREAEKSDAVTEALRNQIVARKDLYAEAIRQAQADATESKRLLDAAKGRREEVLSGKAQQVLTSDDMGRPVMGNMGAADRLAELKTLDVEISALAKVADAAKAKVATLTGTTAAGTAAANAAAAATRAQGEAAKTMGERLDEANSRVKQADQDISELSATVKSKLTEAIKSGVFSQKELIDASGLSEMALKRFEEQIKGGTKAQKSAGAAAADMASSIDTLTAAQVQEIETAVTAKHSQEAIAQTYHVTKTQIREVIDSMHEREKVEKEWAAMEKGFNKPSTLNLNFLKEDAQEIKKVAAERGKLQDEQLADAVNYHNKNTELSLSGTALALHQIDVEEAAEKAHVQSEQGELAILTEERRRYYEHLRALATGAAGTEAEQLREMGIVTRDVLEQRAQSAQRLYDYAKAHDYTPEEIAHLKQLAREARDAASQVSKIWDALVDGLKASTGQFASALENAIVNGSGVGKAFAEYATNVAKDFTAAALAFIPVIGPMLSQFAGPIVEGIKRLFGGPSKAELDGRKVVADMEAQLAKTLTAQQKAEAGGVSWKMTVIAVRDAYIAAGHSAEEAEAAVNRLWASSKDGAEAAKKAADEINAVIANSPATLASEAGYKTKEELQAVADKLKSIYDFMEASGKYTADEVADAFKKWQDAAIAAGDASVIAAKETSDAIKKLDDEYKSLADQVAPEAAEAVMGEEEKRARARMAQIEDEKKALEEKAKKEADDAKRTADEQKKAHDDANTTIEKGAEDSHKRTQDYYDQHPWDIWFRYSALNQPPPGVSGSPTPGPTSAPTPAPAPAPSPAPTPAQTPGPTSIANPNRVGTFRDANGNVIGTTGGTGTTGRYYSHGGLVSYLATGGHPGQPKGKDVVPAWLTPRELVLTETQQANLFAMLQSRDAAAETRLSALHTGAADDTMPTNTAQGALFAKLDRALTVTEAALTSFTAAQVGNQAGFAALITERNRIMDDRLEALISGRADDTQPTTTASGKLFRQLDDALTGAENKLKAFTGGADTSSAAFIKAGSPGLGSKAGAFVQLPNGQWVPRDHPLAQQAAVPRMAFDGPTSAVVPEQQISGPYPLDTVKAAMRPDELSALTKGYVGALSDGFKGTSDDFLRQQLNFYQTLQEGDSRLKTYFYGSTIDAYKKVKETVTVAGSSVPGAGSSAGAFVQLANGQWVPRDNALAQQAGPRGAATTHQILTTLLTARDQAAETRLTALHTGAADDTQPTSTAAGALFAKLDHDLTVTNTALTSFTAAQVGNQSALTGLISERNRIADQRLEALTSGRADDTTGPGTASGRLFKKLDDALTGAEKKLHDFTDATHAASAAFAKAGSPGLGSKAGAFTQLDNGQWVPRDSPLFHAEQMAKHPAATASRPVPIDAGGSAREDPGRMALSGGGMVTEYHAAGGVAGELIRFVPKGTDQIPAMLTKDEGVINVSPGMQRLEPEGVHALNTGKPLPMRIIEKLIKPGAFGIAASLAGILSGAPQMLSTGGVVTPYLDASPAINVDGLSSSLRVSGIESVTTMTGQTQASQRSATVTHFHMPVTINGDVDSDARAKRVVVDFSREIRRGGSSRTLALRALGMVRE